MHKIPAPVAKKPKVTANFDLKRPLNPLEKELEAIVRAQIETAIQQQKEEPEPCDGELRLIELAHPDLGGWKRDTRERIDLDAILAEIEEDDYEDI